LNSDQSVLTLSPTKATRTSVLTVTAKLDNYSTVTFSQDITAIVEGAIIEGVIVEQPAPVAVVEIAVVQPLRIPNMALNATISQEALLDLPKFDAKYTYMVVSKPKFEA